jgi:hypothetical protein
MYRSLRSPVLALAGVVVMGASAAAQEAQSPLVGAWTLASQQGDVIAHAIERGTADMNFVTRPIARRRLRATNNAYATIEIRDEGGSITTVLEGRSITSPADGRAIRWTREDGEVLQVATTLRDGALVQTFAAEDGSRESTYTATPDGRRLTLQITIRSGRLPAPIVYRIAYDRAS